MKKVILFSLIFCLIFIFGCSSNTTNVKPVSTSISIGDDAILDEGSDFNNSVLVSTTPNNLDEVSKLIAVNDRVGMAEMVLNGQIFFVDKGTQVLVIDGGFTSLKVRIMSGDHYGESGWVPMEFCKK
jgi:hypothetical protein